MAVPSLITDLSSTAASNSPAGSEAIGTNADNYIRAGFAFIHQLFDTGIIYSGTVGGTADVITLTPTPALTAYKAGQGVAFIASGANTTNVTVNVSSLGAKAITKNGSTALVAGDIVSGALAVAIYDGTQFQIIDPFVATAPFVDSAALVKGSGDATKLFRIEVDGNTTGTTRVMTPPDENFTAVGLASTQTLTNKTLDSATNTLKVNGTQVTAMSNASATVAGDSSGTWTPACTAGSITTAFATYERVGNLVLLNFEFTMPASATGTAALVTGLPVAIADNSVAGVIGANSGGAVAIRAGTAVGSSTTMGFISNLGSGAASTFANLSSTLIRGSLVYRA